MHLLWPHLKKTCVYNRVLCSLILLLKNLGGTLLPKVGAFLDMNLTPVFKVFNYDHCFRIGRYNICCLPILARSRQIPAHLSAQ